MGPLTISPDKTHLLRDGTPFFWLADTCWSAFTNISMEEWEAYLDLRQKQGFNVLQINTLPQWDRCGSKQSCFPFPTKDGARFDFHTLLPDYFQNARHMCQKAIEKGFSLMLVVMWCNYVPGTWAANICSDNIIPEECVDPIIRTICEAFNEFHPIYAVSGDTGFDEEETVDRYRLVADCVDSYAPGALKAWHIKGRYDGLPQEFAERTDLYLYQSGHNQTAQHMSRKLAETFAARTPKHPVINSEPCYEQMGYSHRQYGRFYRKDIRYALWNSLLSGACAGITYGAHGVWNWQKPGMPLNPIGGEGFLQAMPVCQALRFPGALDFAFAKCFFEQHGITHLHPCQEIVVDHPEEIRAARSEREILLYLPVNAPFSLKGSFADYRVCALDLSTGEEIPFTLDCADHTAFASIHCGYEDVLLILEKNR
ncbi:MAG: DUF4038 domain-containing protein [Eubacterium sp.]|nr:DUF4038 domain-containing protein [Eubacterium sp.]